MCSWQLARRAIGIGVGVAKSDITIFMPARYKCIASVGRNTLLASASALPSGQQSFPCSALSAVSPSLSLSLSLSLKVVSRFELSPAQVLPTFYGHNGRQ